MSFYSKKWLLGLAFIKYLTNDSGFALTLTSKLRILCLLQYYVFKGKQKVEKLYGIFSLTLTKSNFFICLGNLENYSPYKTALNMCVVQCAKMTDDQDMTIF